MPTPGVTIQAMLDAFEAMGLDVPKLREAARLREAPQPSQFLPDEVFATLWETAARELGRDTVALEAARSMPLGAFGMLDYYASATETIGCAVSAVQTGMRHVALGVALEIERAGDDAWTVRVVSEPFVGRPFSDELLLGTLWFRVRAAATIPVELDEVALIRGRSPDADAFRDLMGCPVRFDAAHSSLRVSETVWAAPMGGRDPRLTALLGSSIEQTPDPVVLAVRASVRRRLGEVEPSVGAVARDIGMSSRSLQRRLADEGTQFRTVVTDVRRDIAEELLRDPSASLLSVAHQLGFHDQASFSRAFRRWTGTTPGRWRKTATGKRP